MEKTLIEITNRMLFTEYLQHMRVRAPSLQQEWVYTRGKRILARIQAGPSRLRFFIDASSMTPSHRSS